MTLSLCNFQHCNNYIILSVNIVCHKDVIVTKIMVLLTGDKILIKALAEERLRDLLAEFPNKTWTLSGLSYHTQKIDATATGSAKSSKTEYGEQKRKHCSQGSQPGTH